MEQAKNTLSGVNCTVQECIYHKSGDKCTASSIAVHGEDPGSCSETECATFQRCSTK